MGVDGVICCHDSGSGATAQRSVMNCIAVIIIQKENLLIASCRFDREVPCKIRIDQLGWPKH